MLKLIWRNLMNVQVPFYFMDENNENTWFHVSQQGERMDWGSKLDPSHILHVHSKSCLSSPPASRACNALVFLRSQIKPAAVGFYELLESTRLSAWLRTCKQYVFLLSSKNVSSAPLCEKPIHKSLPEQEQPRSALPMLWLCTRYNSVNEVLLWQPRYKFWA